MLSFKRFIAEAKNAAHVSTTIMTGVAPFPHMGHVDDLGGLLKSLPGVHKIFAMSSKSKAFSDEDRKNILTRQTGGSIEPLIANEHDEIVAHAWNKVKDHPGPKILHLVGGIDRNVKGPKGQLGMLDRLVNGMRSGKIKNPGFDEIHGHTPKGVERSHGMSGTKMRTAAATGNKGIFRAHLGPAFSPEEADDYMAKTKASIDSGEMPLKR